VAVAITLFGPGSGAALATVVGVLVEGVLGVASNAVTEQRSLDLAAAPWLGPVYASPAGLVQLFVAEEVFPAAVLDALLGSAVA
jgi:hypothetical protein